VVSITEALAKSFGVQLNELSLFLRENWGWPSAETGFAVHVFDSAQAEALFPLPQTSISRDVLRRLGEAPVLAATGYVLQRTAESNDRLTEAWARGLERLSARKAFPADRASFFYRPVELLGVCLGAVGCAAAREEDLRWLRGVLKEGEWRLVGSDTWTLSLGACASHALESAWGPKTLVPLKEMRAEELALLIWISEVHRRVAGLLGIAGREQELERELLIRCATSPVFAQDASRAAVLYRSLRQAVSKVIESEHERRWQIHRGSRDALQLLRTVCTRFHLFARQLSSRRQNRETVEITDEYDVQDLMHALLKLHFDDVRPEEWTPSYAGRSSRMDFLLKPEKIVVETKMTRKNLDQKRVAEELTIDKDRYRKHPDCETLVAFVYDPEGRCTNPAALENDLSEESDALRVSVIVAPKGT